MQQPKDVASFEKEQFLEVFVEWKSHASHLAHPMGYDAWMDAKFLGGPATAQTFKKGKVFFELVHGAMYEVRAGKKGQRIFRCLLANGVPFASFRNPALAADFPWVALPGVFSQAELMSLRRIT